MVSLTIKGVPDDLYTRLKSRAETHRRSLNSEVILCLEQSIRQAPPDAESLLAKIDALRNRIGGPPLTDRELRAARRKGRP